MSAVPPIFGSVLSALAVVVACSASDNGAGSGGSGGLTTGGSTSGGAAGAGGSAANAGSGGGIVIDGGGGSAGLASDAACSQISQKAENKLQPADIIFALDNSGSMDEEAKFVQTHMNTFSSGIFGSNVDAHVVVLSAASNQSNGVCIAPPLGSGQCPGDDKPPNYLHLKQSVGSTDALIQFINQFPNYSSMLRTGASKHFVVVTDDNSSMSATEFHSKIAPLLLAADPLFKKYTFHAIYGFTEPSPFVCIGNVNADPCCDKSGFPGPAYTASVGTVYGTLVQNTGGVKGNLCLQNFLPVFQAVSQSVVQASKLACDWDIPQPDGGSVDPNLVNVEFSTSGNTQKIGYAGNLANCANVQGGWYFDDPLNPKKVFVCPDTCNVIQGVSDAEIRVLLGCKREVAVPK